MNFALNCTETSIQCTAQYAGGSRVRRGVQPGDGDIGRYCGTITLGCRKMNSDKHSKVILEAVKEDKPQNTLSRFDILRNIILNLPEELRKFGQIPCAQQSIYTGIITGGAVSALSLTLTGKNCLYNPYYI